MSSSTPVDMEISDGSDTNSDMDVSDSDQEVEPIVTYPSSSSAVPFTNQPAMASASYVTARAEYNPRSYHPYTDQGAIAKQVQMNTFYPAHDAVSAPAVGIPSYDYSNSYGGHAPYMELPHHTIHFNPHVAPQTVLGGFGKEYEPVGGILPGISSTNLSNTALDEDTLSESGYYTAPGSPTNDVEDEEPGLIKSDDDELEGLTTQLEYYQRQIDDFDKEIDDISKDKRRLEHEYLRLRVQHSMVQNRRKAKGSAEPSSVTKKGPMPPKSPVLNPTNHPPSRTPNQEPTLQESAPSRTRSLAPGPISASSPSLSALTDAKRIPVAKPSPSPSPLHKTPTTMPLSHRSHIWTNPHIGKKDLPAAAPSSSAPKTLLPGPGIQRLAGAASRGPSISTAVTNGVQLAKLVRPNILPSKNQQQPKQPAEYQNDQIQRTGLETSQPTYSAGVPFPPPPSSKPKKKALASEKNAFRPYDSPLRRLGITKGHPNNQQQRPTIPNESLTREMCQFEIAGTCNDDTCTALHFRDFEGTMSR